MPRKPVHRRMRRTRKGLTKKQKIDVKKIIHAQAETKWFIVNSPDSGAYGQMDRAGQLTDLMAVPQGDTVVTRDGDTIQANKLEMRLSAYYYPAAVSTDLGHKLRITLFKWNITTGVNAPSSNQVYQNAGGIGNYQVIVSPISYQLLEENDITLIYDKTFQINHTKDLYLHKVFNLKNYKLTYDQGATTGPHKIYMQIVSDDATGAHVPGVFVTWTSRLLFSDI